MGKKGGKRDGSLLVSILAKLSFFVPEFITVGGLNPIPALSSFLNLPGKLGHQA